MTPAEWDGRPVALDQDLLDLTPDEMNAIANIPPEKDNHWMTNEQRKQRRKLNKEADRIEI